MRKTSKWNYASALILLAVFLVPVAGGAAVTSPIFERHELYAALRERGLDPEDVTLPHKLTSEMRRWVRENVPSHLGDERKIDYLLHALFDNGGVEIEYSWGYTGTAAEAFANHRANCLAYTNLFVALAREAGVPVYFLAVERQSYRKSGEFVVISDHVAVGYGPGPTIRMFDFAEDTAAEPGDVRVISDITAIAMFHSNRGAEALQLNQVHEAVKWLKTAVALDPELTNAWINLGVALRRTGDARAAEVAYKKVLEIDPRTHTVYQNLAGLLRLEGREWEAQELEQALGKSPSRNPYSYLSLGDISLRSGRLDEARRFYRRAAALGDKIGEPYAALGELALAEGDEATAQKMLKKARKLDPDHDRTRRLASLIANEQAHF